MRHYDDADNGRFARRMARRQVSGSCRDVGTDESEICGAVLRSTRQIRGSGPSRCAPQDDGLTLTQQMADEFDQSGNAERDDCTETIDDKRKL